MKSPPRAVVPIPTRNAALNASNTMKKLDTLRQKLLTGGLNIQPEDLIVRATSGKVRHHYQHPDQPGNHNLRLEYTAEVLVLDYSGPPEALCYLAGQWLSAEQPGHAATAISFRADILDNNHVDLLLTVEGLTDTYHVQVEQDGTRLDNCPAEHIDRQLYPPTLTP